MSESLLHVEQTVEAATVLEEIPCQLIDPNPNQPRNIFDQDEIGELADSIRRVGLIQPIVVRRTGTRYEIVAGERRWRASMQMGALEIPALVRKLDVETSWIQSLLENLDRKNLNGVEEGDAYVALIEGMKVTQEELGKLIGRSRAHISHAVSVSRLPEGIRLKIGAGLLTFGHAKCLAGIKDPWVASELAKTIVRESLTVRQTEERVILGGLPGWEGSKTPARGTRKRTVPSENVDAARRLSERLDTSVKVYAGKKRGRIVIDFADGEDLKRVMSQVFRDLRDGNS
jgi:ParB family chromosome partitioning protein